MHMTNELLVYSDKRVCLIGYSSLKFNFHLNELFILFEIMAKSEIIFLLQKNMHMGQIFKSAKNK